MKTSVVVLIVALSAIINYASCIVPSYHSLRSIPDQDIDSNESSNNYTLEYLKNYIKKNSGYGYDSVTLKFEEYCPGKGAQFEDAIKQIKRCSDDIDEFYETGCSIMKKHFIECSRPMVELLEGCVPTESKQIPNMVFNSVVSMIDYLCKSDGEHIFELANDCIYQFSYRTARCERLVKTKVQAFSKNPTLLTKEHICEFNRSIRPCLELHLRNACGSQITRDAFTGLIDAANQPCSINTSEIEPATERSDTIFLNPDVELLS